MPGAKPQSMGRTLQNVLARMLPLQREQAQVYRLGDASPPSGGLEGYAPAWEVLQFNVAALGTAQVRVALQRDFTWLSTATSTSSNVSGGFRAQLYDVLRKVRFADRGVLAALIGGNSGPPAPNPTNPFFLREPYRFQRHDSQLLAIVQNLEAVQTSMQIVLYGQCLPFNRRHRNSPEYPGGPVSSSSPGSSPATAKG